MIYKLKFDHFLNCVKILMKGIVQIVIIFLHKFKIKECQKNIRKSINTSKEMTEN